MQSRDNLDQPGLIALADNEIQRLNSGRNIVCHEILRDGIVREPRQEVTEASGPMLKVFQFATSFWLVWRTVMALPTVMIAPLPPVFVASGGVADVAGITLMVQRDVTGIEKAAEPHLAPRRGNRQLAVEIGVQELATIASGLTGRICPDAIRPAEIELFAGVEIVEGEPGGAHAGEVTHDAGLEVVSCRLIEIAVTGVEIERCHAATKPLVVIEQRQADVALFERFVMQTARLLTIRQMLVGIANSRSKRRSASPARCRPMLRRSDLPCCRSRRYPKRSALR